MSLKKIFSDLKSAVTGESKSQESAPGNAGRSAPVKGPDGYLLDPSTPLYRWHDLLSQHFNADLTATSGFKPVDDAAGRQIREASPEEQVAAVEAILLRLVWLAGEMQRSNDSAWRTRLHTCVVLSRKLLVQLQRRKLPYTPAQAASAVTILSWLVEGGQYYDINLAAILKVCEDLKARELMSPELTAALQKLSEAFATSPIWQSADIKRSREFVRRLIGGDEADALDRRDAWAETILKYLAGLSDKQRDAWNKLIAFAGVSTSAKPASKWLKEADRLLLAVGKEEFAARVVEWFPQVRSSIPVNPNHRNEQPPIIERNADILKGFVWCCSQLENENAIRAVSDLTQACYKKIPGIGPLSARVGNAGLNTLSRLPGMAPIAQLSRLRLRIKYAVALKLIDRALQEAAEALGMTSEELEEVAVPMYGLDAQGCLREEFGEFTAELKILGTHETELSWIKADGKPQKSVPAVVKEQFAEDFKEFKRAIKDIETMLPAQSDRIERLFTAEREWEFDRWSERYLDHPLLCHIARRLIWHFKIGDRNAAAIWHDGKLVDVENRPLEGLSSKVRVRLWHPLGCDVEVVAGWRRWLDTHQVTQPFKQAHREIYVLTDAERQTDTYSNRFAAHIIRQHQFAALAKQRGWRYTLQGCFDSHNTPTLLLPRWNLFAEFWVEAPGGRENTSEMGIFLNLSTDQVRFCREGPPLSLHEVPALIFSEVMRDVDLFVGVCSIGNDPTWQDSGAAAPYGAYWHTFSFGDLSATAQTRRDVLERLMPRLKIASRCELREKFLVVRGSVRTYKIHLGSGNILMEPNDQYLCIVADRSGAAARKDQELRLPFEGDHTLALILSKAFMLADDAKIKDPSITKQIK